MPSLPPELCVNLQQLLQCRFANQPSSATNAINTAVSGSGRFASQRQFGRGIDFAEIRDYRAGDDVRHMDWRTTAKTGKAHIKCYHTEKEQPLFLIIDLHPGMYFGTKVTFKSVIAAQAAAYIALDALRCGDRIGGMVLHQHHHFQSLPTSGQAPLLGLLGALSQATQSLPQQAVSLSDALLRLQRLVRPGSRVMLISDFEGFSEQTRRLWLPLQRSCQLVAICIRDPIERIPPPPGCYAITDGQQQATLDTSRPQVEKALKNYRQQQKQALIETFGHQCLWELSTDQSVAITLRQQMRRQQLGKVG